MGALERLVERIIQRVVGFVMRRLAENAHRMEEW